MTFQNKDLDKDLDKELKKRRNPFLKRAPFFVCLCHLIFYTNSLANSNPQSFTFEGVLLDTDGVPPVNGVVNFNLGIYDPSGACLLYEQQIGPLDLTTYHGSFSVEIGTPVGDPSRTANDPGLDMADLFANGSSSLRARGSPNCKAGYLPSPGDLRSLKVTAPSSGSNSYPVTSDTVTSDTVTSDISINSTPYATVAETLQGIAPKGFLQPNPSQNLSQATLAQLTAEGDASALHNHDSLYAKLVGGNLSLGSNTYLNLGSHTSTPALGPSDVGKIWFNANHDTIQYYNGTAVQTLSTLNNTSYSTLGVGGTPNPNTQLESTITNPSNVGLLIQGSS
jgi:hypothetical protein